MADEQIAEGERCSKCGETKPCSEFPKTGRQCADCLRRVNRAAVKRYRETHRVERKEYERRYDLEHRSERRAKSRQRYRKYHKEQLEAAQQYREANPEKVRAATRKWALNNPDKVAAYREATKEEQSACQAAWYLKNKERASARNRQWKKDNPEYLLIQNSRRRASLAAAGGQFTKIDWQALLAKSPRCHWCKRTWTKSRRPTHDHVIPLSRGGSNNISNSVCACLECNTRKNRKLVNPVSNEPILL